MLVSSRPSSESSRWFPILTWIWVRGHTLKQDAGACVAEGAVDHTGVSGDPANVSYTRKDVPRAVVKDKLQHVGQAVRCEVRCEL